MSKKEVSALDKPVSRLDVLNAVMTLITTFPFIVTLNFVVRAVNSPEATFSEGFGLAILCVISFFLFAYLNYLIYFVEDEE